MSVNKRCPSCGYTVEDGMISCPMCGEPLDIKIVKKGHPILSVVLLLVLWPILCGQQKHFRKEPE